MVFYSFREILPQVHRMEKGEQAISVDKLVLIMLPYLQQRKRHI